MKNSKVQSMKSTIAAQNSETARVSSSRNTSGLKTSGNAKNPNTTGSNCSDTLRKNPNTSQVK